MRQRGRPRKVLIDDPLEERDRGRQLADQELLRWERELHEPRGYFPPYPPLRPTGDLDEGLVYAYYAGYLARRSVKSIVRRTLAFTDWILDRRGARGPVADAAQGFSLYRAIETAAAIRRKLKLPKREPSPTELQQVLTLLEGETLRVLTVGWRLKRLRPRLAEFRREMRARGRHV